MIDKSHALAIIIQTIRINLNEGYTMFFRHLGVFCTTLLLFVSQASAMKYTYGLLLTLLCATTMFGAAHEETFEVVKARFLQAAQAQNLEEALVQHARLRTLDTNIRQSNACKVAENSHYFLKLIADNWTEDWTEKKRRAGCFRSRNFLQMMHNNNTALLAQLIQEKKEQYNEDNGENDNDSDLRAALELSLESQVKGNQRSADGSHNESALAASSSGQERAENINSHETDLTPLMSAVLACDAERVKELIQKRADVNVQTKTGYTALMWAISLEINNEKRIELVQILVNAGADLVLKNNNGKNALELITQRRKHDNNTAIKNILIKAGATVNEEVVLVGAGQNQNLPSVAADEEPPYWQRNPWMIFRIAASVVVVGIAAAIYWFKKK